MTAPSLRVRLERDFSAVFRGYSHATFIGCGGQGQVFRAWGPRGVCAIKVFGLDDSHQVPTARESIRREIATAQRITAVIDGLALDGQDRLVGIWNVLGQHQAVVFHGRQLFALVMRYFNEGTMDSWRTARSHLDLWTLHSLINDVAAGLTCLHVLKLVHHDLKPSNIFIATETTDGVPRPRAFLGDFGCTRHQQEHMHMLDLRYAPLDHAETSGLYWDVYSMAMVALFLVRGDLADDAWQVAPFSGCRLTVAHSSMTNARTCRHVTGASSGWYDDMLRLIIQASAFHWQRRPSPTEFALAVYHIATTYSITDADNFWDRLRRTTTDMFGKVSILSHQKKPQLQLTPISSTFAPNFGSEPMSIWPKEGG